MKKSVSEMLGQLSALYPEQRLDLLALFQEITRYYSPADAELTIQALKRYTTEGTQQSYQADTRGLLQLALRKGWIDTTERVVDLGAGPGNFVRDVASTFPQKAIQGIDLSPSFVANFNRTNPFGNARMTTGLIDIATTPLKAGLQTASNSVSTAVFSTLTLDRVTNPRQLIGNMKGTYNALATLLPVNPVDDNPGIAAAQRRTYTTPQNRIVPGNSLREDREILRREIGRIWNCKVIVDQVEYVVASSGDRQAYELYVFSNDRPRTASSI